MDTVFYWTTGRNVSARSLFPIRFYANGFRLPYFLLISCCMQSFSKPRIKSVVPSAELLLRPPLTALNTARIAGSGLPADRQRSAWENGAPLLRSRGKKSLDLRGFQCLKMTRQGFYTLSPQNDVLLRNKYQKHTYIKQGADSLLLAVCALFLFFQYCKLGFITTIFCGLFCFFVLIETPYTYEYWKSNDTIINFGHTSSANSIYQVWNSTQ